VCRRGIEVEIALFAILAVISLVASEAEESLLQNGVAFVPKGEREADLLVAVADARESVFIPPVSGGSCVVMRQVFPRGTTRAVVFAYGAPCALGKIRSPSLPMLGSQAGLFKASFFSGHVVLLQIKPRLPCGIPENLHRGSLVP
jgi:hypothetical protein